METITLKQAEKWFRDAMPWLRKWLKCSKPSRAKRFQTFRRSRTFYLDSPRSRGMTKAQIVKLLTEDLDSEYTPMTLRTLVFGKKHSMDYGDGKTVHHIAGFYEQTGRLPTPRDRVILWQLHPKRLGKNGDAADVYEGPSTIEVIRVQFIARLEIKTLAPVAGKRHSKTA